LWENVPGGDPPYDLSDATLRELAGLETVDAGGVLVTRAALTLLHEAGVHPGELVARYLEGCVRSGRIALVGYYVDPDREPRGSGALHVVLDPERHRVVIYEEFC